MSQDTELLTFPCDFPIKIIGDSLEQFEAEIIEIAKKHHPELLDSSVTKKLSKEGNYIAISITVFTSSQEALDALYADLVKHPNTKMVL